MKKWDWAWESLYQFLVASYHGSTVNLTVRTVSEPYDRFETEVDLTWAVKSRLVSQASPILFCSTATESNRCCGREWGWLARLSQDWAVWLLGRWQQFGSSDNLGQLKITIRLTLGYLRATDRSGISWYNLELQGWTNRRPVARQLKYVASTL